LTVRIAQDHQEVHRRVVFKDNGGGGAKRPKRSAAVGVASA
jgi:hypothetical protein